jgi:hypothetical protein
MPFLLISQNAFVNKNINLEFSDDWQSANTKGALNGSTSPKTLGE